VLWIFVGGPAFFYSGYLRPQMASFGAELPVVSSSWVACRPIFLLMLLVGSAGAALLPMKPALRFKSSRPGWAAVGIALFCGAWSVYAVFAPMFLGGIHDPVGAIMR